jgi:hypothetical protein
MDGQTVQGISLAYLNGHWSMPGETATGQAQLDDAPDGGCLFTECLDGISSRLADVQSWYLQLWLHVAHTRFSVVVFKR